SDGKTYKPVGRSMSRTSSRELAAARQRLAEPTEVFPRGEVDRPEAAQVRRGRLGVEQLEPALLQATHQVDECDFAGVAAVVEHALAEEGAAEAHAVQAAGQLAGLPGLDAVGEAELVQPAIGPDQLIGDPGAIAACVHA